MKAIPFRWILALGFLFVAVGMCWADTPRGKIEAVFVTWEPFGYLEGTQAVGFELDIFRAVAAELNLDVSFHERPWKRCLYMIEHGSADALISALKTPEREVYMLFPDEFISISATAFFTVRSSPIRFDGNLENLRGKIIGITSGFSYGSAFDEADYLIKDENTKTETIIPKLLMGRYDLGIGSVPVINSLAIKQGV